MNLNSVAVVGAGTMGAGIAQVCAVAGIRVVLVDLSPEATTRGIAAISASLERLVRKGSLVASQKTEVLSRIVPTQTYDALADVDIAIEAVTENVAIKRDVLTHIEKNVRVDTVVASNTSSISISEMAAWLSSPERFVGMHFFNPVAMMPLVEIIRGLQTSDDAHAVVDTLSRRVGKTPVTVRNSPGFAVNRILCPMINEAIFALQDGIARAEDIDTAMRLGCNHPIGPLALADMVGLDVLLSVMTVFYDGFNDPKYRPAPLLKEMVAAGRLGRKTGQGFFYYDS